ncbi:LytTR family DNA-binding domain-containing protein [Sediminibacterium sp. C3]|uniref:LytR/AlgR family response regulator transcription factor n=1 Tax=Sediminibacterium sp. C3 TaxID=1267211 RepID=UPI00041BBFA1|nr:LytTR family DNA-binding domain-containing protein [Sediminibacterium sp. C3]
MKAIIIEDEVHSQIQLTKLLYKFCPDISIEGIADNVESGLSLFYEKKPDTIFLDIELGTENGFNLLQAINTYNFSVIFTTAHDKYSLKAIKYAALDYLLKPVQVHDLVMSVEKAKVAVKKENLNQQMELLLNEIKNSSSESQSIAIPQSRDIRIIRLKDIIYLESENNYTKFHLIENEQLLVSKGIYYYDELLSRNNFIRIHQSYLVNKAYIKSISSSNEIVLFNKERLPISRLKMAALKEALLNYTL